MAKQKCSPKTRNSRNRNWRRMLIVVFRPFMTGERTTRTAHAILNYETISRRASEPKLTTASGCLLLPASFSSIRRTLRMFLTLFRLRAAGLQRSLNSRSGIKRGRELAPRHKGKELGRLNPQLTTTSSPWESILASSDPSLITITRLFKIRKPQSVAPAPTSSRPCRLRRSEEHTSELQSHSDLVCRLLLEKKKKKVGIGMRLRK